MHLKTILKELSTAKIGNLKDASWPLEILEATQSANDHVRLATYKMLSPLVVHLSPQPLKLLQTYLLGQLKQTMGVLSESIEATSNVTLVRL